jgi:hypothetical protein
MTQKDRSRLAVIVVSYQVRELLDRCLDSFAGSRSSGANRLAIETWVVDNASTDGSAEMVRQRHPRVRLIANQENRGFAAASNQALREVLQENASCYVLLLNPDTEVVGDALNLLVDHLEQFPEVGAVGPALVYPDGRFQHSAFAFPGVAQLFLDLFPLHGRLIESRLNGRYPRDWYAAGQPFDIDHPLGAALMVRTDVVEQVGLLDEQFFMYGEEVDWCWRIKKAGWVVRCVPEARVVHHEGRSTAQFREAMFVALWQSRRRLYARHHGPVTNWLARRVVCAGIRRRMKLNRARHARGELDASAWESQQRAYEQVLNEWSDRKPR